MTGRDADTLVAETSLALVVIVARHVLAQLEVTLLCDIAAGISGHSGVALPVALDRGTGARHGANAGGSFVVTLGFGATLVVRASEAGVSGRAIRTRDSTLGASARRGLGASSTLEEVFHGKLAWIDRTLVDTGGIDAGLGLVGWTGSWLACWMDCCQGETYAGRGWQQRPLQ